MTGIITTALMGFFVLSGVGSAFADASSAPQAPQLPTLSVTMTGYNAVAAQTDSDPSRTSIGASSNPDIIAARSSDLADQLPYGSVIEITAATSSASTCGYDLVNDMIGLRVVGDAMNARIHDRIDIMLPSSKSVVVGGKATNPARTLGYCDDVQITVVGYVDPAHIPATQAALAAAIGIKQADAQSLAVKK